MKQFKRCFLTVVLLVSLCTGFAAGQQEGPFPNRRDMGRWRITMQEMGSPVLIEKMRLDYLEIVRQKGLQFYRCMPADVSYSINLELGAIPMRRLGEKLKKCHHHDSKILELFSQTVKMESLQDPFWANRNSSDAEEYLKLWQQIYERRTELWDSLVNENFTPEQKKRHGEIQMMFLSTSYPVCEIEAFYSLDLSKRQKLALERLRQCLEPNVNAYREEFARLYIEHAQKSMILLQKANVKSDADFERFVYQLDPKDLRVDYTTLCGLGQEVNQKMLDGVSQILTRTQRKKMEKFIQEPPERIQKLIEEIEKAYASGILIQFEY